MVATPNLRERGCLIVISGRKTARTAAPGLIHDLRICVPGIDPLPGNPFGPMNPLFPRAA